MPRRARRVTARALSVLVMTRRAVEQCVALDAAGAIELRVEPLAVTVLATAEHDQPELDCLTADIICAESIARLRSATRRAPSRTQHSRIRYADVTLDTVCLKVWRKGRIVPLTVFQLRLLQFLMTHPGECSHVGAC